MQTKESDCEGSQFEKDFREWIQDEERRGTKTQQYILSGYDFYCENQKCPDYRIFNPKPRHLEERKGKCGCGFYYVPIIHWCDVIDEIRITTDEIRSTNEDATRVITKEMRYLILKEQKWNCNLCGNRLKYSKDSQWKGRIAHVDHIHPFAKRHTYKGHINERENLQALCPECNLKKAKGYS